MALTIPVTKKLVEVKTFRNVFETEVKVYSDGTVETNLVNGYSYKMGNLAKKAKVKKPKKQITMEDEGVM